MSASRAPSKGGEAAEDEAMSSEDPALAMPRDKTIAALQGEEKAALNFLARRGSEAEKSSEEEFEDEAMANAERDLKADAEWKRIQQNTFTRWANEHLKQANQHIEDLETDLSNGLKLIALLEVLSGKRLPRHNKKPNFRSQKLENVSIALQFLEQEGVTLVNIDSTDIVDCKLKLILGLIWTLILHYAISMPMWDGPPLGGNAAQPEKTPKQRLLNWLQDKVPGQPVQNLTKDWQDGKAVGALVDSVAPGLCPDWEDWDPERPVENAKEAMDLADKWLNVPKLLTPEELVNPNIDEQSMMTYLSQFPNAKLKPGAPLRKKANVDKVRAYGPGLEPTGLVAKAPAKFVVETFGAGDGDVKVGVTGPSGEKVPCDVVYNNDRKKTYACKYFPEEEGDYVVKVHFGLKELPKSPYQVLVEGFAGDATKVRAEGPGLEAEGVIINKPTWFKIYATNAGKGMPEVIILDPKGKKDTVPVRLTPVEDEEDVYKCQYAPTQLGLHSINVFFAGNPIKDSPFGVKVSPASNPNKVYTSGRGLQPQGIRQNETVSFRVHTENAGEGDVGVKILGPGGHPLDFSSKKLDPHTVEVVYTPVKKGRHIAMITFAQEEIARSPFEINIGPRKESRITAYGPGLKGGVVDMPAKFTVDTNGETGALGFSIKGPSQAKINCNDNGDGSADVDYIPTCKGEYAIHILCDKEDIPGSPYMAQILPQTDYFPDKVKVTGPGIENGVLPNETTYFDIDTTKAGDAPLEVAIVDDLGTYEPDLSEKPNKKGLFHAEYQPRPEQTKQTVMVNFGGVAVPGSPFRVQNDNVNDPSLVKVYGPGVTDPIKSGRPTEFFVDCSESGPGDLQVSIENTVTKAKVPITISSAEDATEDANEDTWRIAYEPTDEGLHVVAVTLDGIPVKDSPFKVHAEPSVDTSKIKLNNFETEVFVDCTNEFEVDASALPNSDLAMLVCEITDPEGQPLNCYINKGENDGIYQVSYIPTEEGTHEILLEYNDEPLPDSPYPVEARYGCEPNRVKAYGDGLERGIVDEDNTFVIETKNAGAGGLGLAIEGPSEAIMMCHDNKDGTATVNYVPTEEGDYEVAVKFGEQHIPGSPFIVPCTTRDGHPKANAELVKAFGPGLEPGQILPGKPTHFTVDTTATATAPLQVVIRDESGEPLQKKPAIKEKTEGVFDVSYVPPPVGDPYEVCVRYAGVNIPGSPFPMTSSVNLEDVISDELYQENGSGIQKKGDQDDKDRMADLLKRTTPNVLEDGKERGGLPRGEEESNVDARSSPDSDDFKNKNARNAEKAETGAPFRTDSRGQLLDHNGEPLNAAGAPFRTDANGDIFDKDGLPVGNGHSGPFKTNSKGDLLDRAGKPINAAGGPFRTDSRGNILDKDGHPIVDGKERSSRKKSSDDLLDKDGKPVDARGGPFRTDSRSSILGKDKPGPFRTDSQGNMLPVEEDNNKDNLLDAKGNSLGHPQGPFNTNMIGDLVDQDGNPVNTQGGPFRADSRGNIYDKDGNPIGNEHSGPFRTNSAGDLLNARGQPVNVPGGPFRTDSRGNIYDKDGNPIGNEHSGPFRTNSTGDLLDERGQPVNVPGGPFRTNSRGNVYDKDGNSIGHDNRHGTAQDSRGNLLDNQDLQNKSGPFRTDSRGNIYDKDGNPIGKEGPFRTNSRGDLLDKDGRPVDARGGPFRTDSRGNIYDRDGNPIGNDKTGPFRANSKGALLDRNGRPINHTQSPLRGDSRGNLLDNNGKTSPATNSPFRVNSMGDLIDQDGNPVNISGGPFRTDSRGNIYDKDGNPIGSEQNGPFQINPAGDLLDERGQPVTVPGGPFRTDSRGNIYDKDGNPIGHDNRHTPGQDLRASLLDNQGLQGKSGPFRTDSRGNIYDKDGNPIRKEGPFRTNSRGDLLDKDGRPIGARGGPFRTDSRGNIYDRDGNPVGNDKTGPFRANSRGDLLDRNGRPLSQVPSPLREDSRGNLLDKNGKSSNVTNGPFRTNSMGDLIDQDGNPVNMPGGPFRTDSRGNIYDKDGNPIGNEHGGPFRTNSAGDLLDASGQPVTVPGGPFRTDSRGNIYDKDGNPIGHDNQHHPAKDSRGNLLDTQDLQSKSGPFRTDSRGNIYDKDGNPIGKEGPFRTNSQGDLLDKDGRPVDARGGPFRTDSRGNIYDRDGNPIGNDKTGPFRANSRGDLLDKYGRPVSNSHAGISGGPQANLDGISDTPQYGNKKLSQSNSRSNVFEQDRDPVHAPSGPFRTDSRGDIYGKHRDPFNHDSHHDPASDSKRLDEDQSLQSKSGPFRKDSRGNIYDNDGNPIGKEGPFRTNSRGDLLDKDGIPVDARGGPFRTDSRGNIYDRDGNPIGNDKTGPFRANSRGDLLDRNGMPINHAQSPFRGDSRGNLLDKNGKPSQGTNGPFRTNSVGDLVDQDGNPVNVPGGPFRTDSRGNIYDKDGNPIGSEHSGPFRTNSVGELLDETGRPVDVPGGPFSTDSRGNICDKDGNPIGNDSGCTAGQDSKSRLPDNQGLHGRSGALRTNSRGDLLDKDGRPVDARGGPFRTDSRGNIYDRDGNPIGNDKTGPIRANSRGNLLDRTGKPVSHAQAPLRAISRGSLFDGTDESAPDQNAPFTTNSMGDLIDKDGNPINVAGGPFNTDSRGNICDSNGYPIDNEHTGPFKVNPHGDLTDQAGNPVHVPGGPYRTDSRGNIYNKDGTPIGHDNQQHHAQDARGTQNEDQNLQSKSGPFRTDSRGNIYDKDGNPIGKEGPFRTNSRGALLDKDGRPVDARGGPFRTDSRGNIYDRDGNPIGNDKTGPFRANSRGDLLDKNGIPINHAQSPLRGDSRGNLLDKNGKPSNVTNGPFRTNSMGDLIDQDGNPVNIPGGPFRTDSRGNIYDKDGNPVGNEHGGPFRTNSAGDLLDETGQTVNVSGGPFRTDSRGNIYDKDGNPIGHDNRHGNAQDSRGNLLDNQDLQGKSGPFRTDSRGNIYDKDGNPIGKEGPFRTNSRGDLLDKDGRPVDVRGGPFRTDSRGSIYDRDGNPIGSGKSGPFRTTSRGDLLDRDGNPIGPFRADSRGNMYDQDRNPLGDPSQNTFGNVRSDSKANILDNNQGPHRMDSKGQLLGKNGAGLYSPAGPLRGDSKGSLFGADNSDPKHGAPYRTDSKGNIFDKDGNAIGNEKLGPFQVDLEGNLIDTGRRPHDADARESKHQSGSQSQYHDTDPNKSLLNEPIYSNANPGNQNYLPSGPFTTSPNGNLLDQNGVPVYVSGGPFETDANGVIVDHDGNPIANAKAGPLRTDSLGQLLDDRGRVLIVPGGPFHTDSRGNILDKNNIPISLDSNESSKRGGAKDRKDSKRSQSENNYPPIELSNLPVPSTSRDITATVHLPDSTLAQPFIENNGNGSIGLSYQPNQTGLHDLTVTHDGEPIQGSPYKFYATPLQEGKVQAYGPGLTHAVCGEPGNFVISAKGAGARDLALAVEGPSEAEIQCHDNKDGTVNVSYLPTAPGEYKISAKFADEPIDGSPFTCKVTGEGKKRNAISVGASSDVSLPDNLSDYDLRALEAYIISPSGNEEPCFLKKLPKGNTGISFTPREEGEHLVSVKREGKHIKNSPFKIRVQPTDVGNASKVLVHGSGLREGKTHKDNSFHVDTRKAGYGGLSLSIEGPSKAEIKCHDHEDGALDVSYRPTEPGLYIINLKFADGHVPGSPFAVPISGEGLEKQRERIKHVREAVPLTEVGSQCKLTFKMPGVRQGDLEATVISPSGKVSPALIAELDDGLYAVNFIPHELGIHTVSVKYNQVDIPGSPFQFTVGPLQDGGAHRVHAGGAGLERGVQGIPADFNVWTREAGHGSLAIAVEGPSKAVVDFKDRKDGSCHVSYTVEEPGEYSVGIRFNEQHIPGSPYKVYIQPSADDAERVRLSNIADIPIQPDAPQTMLLNMNGADGDVECRIVAPSGREDDCFITPLGNGEHSVRFVPKEEGVHHLHVRFNGVHIPGSPFKIVVGNINNNDPSTVVVFGDGVQTGLTGKRSRFVIDTSSVGTGTLSITVDGPSKVDLSCNEVETGYEVSYVPMVPGKYYVTVKYNGKNVSGSPFSFMVNGDSLLSSGSSSRERQRRSSRSSMTMETLKRTSYIRHQYTEQHRSHSISQTPLQVGKIKHERMTTSAAMSGGKDASQISCHGQGLHEAVLHRKNSFVVDAEGAANNILFVGVYGPETPCDEVLIKHQGGKRYAVDYVVREKGKYIIYVKWGDEHVRGSPFHIQV